jgi:macrolide transport system ATP-binding/permease protein
LLDYFRQAARALLSNKVRSGLSMLGILIGVAAVIAMMAIGAGAQKAIKSRLSSLGSNLLMLFPGPGRQGGVSLGAGSYTRFTPDDVNAIRGLSMVRRASAEVRGRGQIVYGGKNWSTSVQGADPDYAAMRAATPIYGRFFTELENAQRARVVVVGATIVRELFGAANPIGEVVRINRQSFQIIGILPQKGASGWHDEDDNVIVPTATAMYRMQGKDYVDSISVEVVSEDRMEAAQEQISALMRRRSRTVSGGEDGFQIRNMAEIQSAVSETSRAFSTLLAAIAAISLLVGGIGIMNIMLVSVTERTREIGLRKAVGARRKDILSQFLIEAVVVSVTGGATGIAVGWGISRIVTGIAGWATDVSPVSVLLAVLFSAGVGVAFGLWPAWKASRLSPIDALRYE